MSYIIQKRLRFKFVTLHKICRFINLVALHKNKLRIVAICRAYHNITGSGGTFAKKIFKQNLIEIKEDSIITAIYIKLCNGYEKKIRILSIMRIVETTYNTTN